MKVVYLAAGTEETLGGETRVAMEISQAMSEYAETALVFTGTENRIYKEDGMLKVTLQGGDYESGELGVFTPNTVQFFFDFLDSFKPDIVHSHSGWLAPFIGQIWAVNNNIPYFYTSHYLPTKIASFFDVSADSFVYKMMNEMIFKQYFQDYLKNCTAVIALNQVASNELRNYGYTGNMHIVPNGRFLERLNSLELQSQKKKERNLIFVGSISKRKNQEYLLKVMKYFPKNFRLTLIGRFLFEDYEKSFRKMASKYRNVEIIDGVSPDKIPGYLEKSHIFVSASIAEVQALSVIEALAAGKPIVGLSNETIDELVDSSVGIWIDRKASPKEFAKSVRKIADLSQNDYTDICKRARHKVDNWDWSDIAKRTYDIYAQYVSVKGKRVSNRRVVRDMINRLPYFPGQSYLLKKFDEYKRENNKNPIGMINKVPKKTLMFAGITVGLAALIFGSLKVSGMIKKKRVSK
ncbi:glycosyltransferase [Candidatus Dojkabacteria bacterium]|nr:glycosyltransferase [Candidatus Dojkabacteria bacterium]